MNRKSIIVPAMLVAGGVGVGSLNPTPEPVQLPSPPAKIQKVVVKSEPEKIEIRYEELKHRADRSLREAFKMDSDALNSDVVKSFKQLANDNKNLTSENSALRAENKRVVDAYNKLINTRENQSSEVRKYYEGVNSGGSR